MHPIAYVSQWVGRSVYGYPLYAGIFVAIFVLMWGIQYFIWKGKIKRINKKIGEKE